MEIAPEDDWERTTGGRFRWSLYFVGIGGRGDISARSEFRDVEAKKSIILTWCGARWMMATALTLSYGQSRVVRECRIQIVEIVAGDPSRWWTRNDERWKEAKTDKLNGEATVRASREGKMTYGRRPILGQLGFSGICATETKRSSAGSRLIDVSREGPVRGTWLCRRTRGEETYEADGRRL